MPKEQSNKQGKKCLWCNVTFFPRKDKMEKTKFCSRKCFDGFSSRNKVDIVCLFCGKKFKVKKYNENKKKYCSKDCLNQDQKTKLKGDQNPHYKNAGHNNCLFCGEHFFSYNKRRKYCSMECYHGSKRKKQHLCAGYGVSVKRGRKYCEECSPIKKQNRYTRCAKKQNGCIICGVVIKKGRKYCEKCSPVGKRYERTCKTCGVKFIARKSGNKSFCSRPCVNIRGKMNPNYKHGLKYLATMIRDCDKNKKLIKKILRRDNYTCQKCSQRGYELHVDHIYPFNKIFKEFLDKNKETTDKECLFNYSMEYEAFWDENNLRVLCKKCNLNRPYKNLDKI